MSGSKLDGRNKSEQVGTTDMDQLPPRPQRLLARTLMNERSRMSTLGGQKGKRRTDDDTPRNNQRVRIKLAPRPLALAPLARSGNIIMPATEARRREQRRRLPSTFDSIRLSHIGVGEVRVRSRPTRHGSTG
ncbi:hypothetical protein MPTK1_2g12670 [Marchantia polymorpha subsp. ruderalis]|uniref:Uncharacterized protein n=1 Tax=Marchantia polymorpha TaxID=3197 RepID=A0A2R6XAT8_MARPO|nr:hypothetical protein MARPO_0026s0104 [Marchantia polymorpha]BBN02089.1 hypothetical protein Mp_2g12670 [Marchantia polymorpha subsp. ruderalis]|eukprot:PTQ43231.1 hypothetical protein MARPO_0026s0104 [Marchantia polymorpha]